MMSEFGYDCLNYDQNLVADASTSTIPFCLRPEILEHSSNDQENSCDGEQVTFEQLKSTNVSTSSFLVECCN